LLKRGYTIAIRSRTVLAVEPLERRDTPAVIGALGGEHAAIILETETDEASTTLHFTVKLRGNNRGDFDVIGPRGGDSALPGLLRAVDGGPDGSR
jgi:hypothetical protein